MSYRLQQHASEKKSANIVDGDASSGSDHDDESESEEQENEKLPVVIVKSMLKLFLFKY
jgi:hypothetical protein